MNLDPLAEGLEVESFFSRFSVHCGIKGKRLVSLNEIWKKDRH
jgi:hypothetical protein